MAGPVRHLIRLWTGFGNTCIYLHWTLPSNWLSNFLASARTGRYPLQKYFIRTTTYYSVTTISLRRVKTFKSICTLYYKSVPLSSTFFTFAYLRSDQNTSDVWTNHQDLSLSQKSFLQNQLLYGSLSSFVLPSSSH
jgi:hypothetical protein